jgi:hypothetical protein
LRIEISVVRGRGRSTPDDFCATAKIGFAAKIQDRYVFRAVVTRAPDGKVIDVISHPAGTLRFGFGASDKLILRR